jgi:hypothetical protein
MRENGCTIVSLVPLAIREEKPGLIPSSFNIAESKGGEPEILHVTTAMHYVYLDETRGSLPVKNPPEDVARAVVEDYVNAQLGVTEDARPALFWLPGIHNAIEVKLAAKTQLAEALVKQLAWFRILCRIADGDWNQYQRHNVISDTQRKAAEILGLSAKEHIWMGISAADSFTRCRACTAPVPNGAIICPTCKCVIDEEKYKSLAFAS